MKWMRWCNATMRPSPSGTWVLLSMRPVPGTMAPQPKRELMVCVISTTFPACHHAGAGCRAKGRFGIVWVCAIDLANVYRSDLLLSIALEHVLYGKN
jgi:hypothetical protein